MTNSSENDPIPNTSTNPNTTYWFKRRRYGIGWIPSTLQGWLSLGLFIGALSLPRLLMSESARNGRPGKIWKFGLTAGYLAFVYHRGPKPKWRWGKSPNDNPLEDA